MDLCEACIMIIDTFSDQFTKALLTSKLENDEGVKDVQNM